jgi:hypothetical protein
VAPGFCRVIGEALFSDGLNAPFRVLSRDPVGVRVVADEPLPQHERAIEAWLAEAPW